MSIAINITSKKNFLKWVLENHNMKRLECVWILNYLLSHENLLENVHFTDEAHHCPRAMVISTTKSESVSFRFYDGNLMTADVEKAFHDLRLYKSEKMYIQFNFPDKHLCPHYASVKEDNLYAPRDTEEEREVRNIARKLIVRMEDKLFEDAMNRQINIALDSGNKELFLKLSKERCERIEKNVK